MVSLSTTASSGERVFANHFALFLVEKAAESLVIRRFTG
jgi:hypothetical protein